MSVIPLFILHTAPDVLAIPGTIDIAGSSAIQPNSTKVILVSVPSLEEGVGAAARAAVVTMLIGGNQISSQVINSGDIITYTAALYNSVTISSPGVIYVRARVGNDQEARRADILARLNSPDFNVVTLLDDTVPVELVRKTVYVEDDAMLRIPIREIVRLFPTVFASSTEVIAPQIAKFSNFSSSGTTTFISLPDDAHQSTTLRGTQQSVLSGITLEQSETWQPPIKMTTTSWIVFGIVWGLMALTLIIGIGVTYQWYISQYL
jgi:hypothetical protein